MPQQFARLYKPTLKEVVKYAKSAPAPRLAPKALQVKKRKVNVKNAFKLSRPMKELVDARIDANKQDHWIRSQYPWVGIQGIPHLNSAGAPSGVWPVIPKIPQVGTVGPGAQLTSANISSREGNQIQLKSIVCNINLVMAPEYHLNDTSYAGIRYRVIIFSCKKYSQYFELINNFFDSTGSDNLEQYFLRDGKDAVPRDSKMENFDLPVNSELFTVHAQRTGKMNRGVAYGDYTGSSAIVKAPNVTLKIPLKVKSRKLLYNTTTENLPTNFNPLIWIGYTAYDGTAMHSGNAVHMVGSTTVRFEDLS